MVSKEQLQHQLERNHQPLLADLLQELRKGQDVILDQAVKKTCYFSDVMNLRCNFMHWYNLIERR